MKNLIKNILPYGLVNQYLQNKVDNTSVENMDEPLIYDSNGNRMRVFYLQDNQSKYYSFTVGRQPNNLFWDRNNPLLKIHFYTDEDIFRTKKTAYKKFGLILEPEVFKPKLYKQLYENPTIVNSFDLIFTHSEKLLNQYENARLYLGQGVWYGTIEGGGYLDSEAYKKKNKNISMVSSNKVILPSHRLRIDIAKRLKNSGFVDTFGKFDGGKYIKVSEALSDYRYSIVLENEISDYYFTEKILNCFASMTIPIYSGARKIGNFFNDDGIIIFDKYASTDDMLNLLKICTDEYYRNHINSIIDNYNRVQKLLCMEDYIFNEYKSFFDI